MSGTAVVFHEAIANIAANLLNLPSGTFYALLSNTAPSQANDKVVSDIAEIAAGFGYSAGGVLLTGVTFAETGSGTGIWKFTCTDFTVTAAGGTIGPFRYIVIYDHTSSKLLCYVDIGTSFSLTDGSLVTSSIGASGIVQIGIGSIP